MGNGGRWAGSLQTQRVHLVLSWLCARWLCTVDASFSDFFFPDMYTVEIPRLQSVNMQPKDLLVVGAVGISDNSISGRSWLTLNPKPFGTTPTVGLAAASLSSLLLRLVVFVVCACCSCMVLKLSHQPHPTPKGELSLSEQVSHFGSPSCLRPPGRALPLIQFWQAKSALMKAVY